MKTEGQIRHKLQQVTFRYLQRIIRTALSRRPENCIHNGIVKLPRGGVRYCTLLEDTMGASILCDEAYGGLDLCSRCPEFKRRYTKDAVREDFTTFLKTSDVPTIAVRYPDLAALLWVLDMGGPVVVACMDEEASAQDPLVEEPPVTTEPSPLPESPLDSPEVP